MTHVMNHSTVYDGLRAVINVCVVGTTVTIRALVDNLASRLLRGRFGRMREKFLLSRRDTSKCPPPPSNMRPTTFICRYDGYSTLVIHRISVGFMVDYDYFFFSGRHLAVPSCLCLEWHQQHHTFS